MYQISDDMLADIARSLTEGATWAWLSQQYGIPPQTLKRAYQRKSRQVHGIPDTPATTLSAEAQATLRRLGLE